MSFAFGNITTKTKKKEINIDRKDPILFEDIQSNNMVVFLFDSFYPKTLLDSFQKWVKKSLPNYSILGLASTPLDFNGDDLKEIVDFYSRNKIDYISVLQPYEKYKKVYVSLGRAIYSITESDALIVDDFYDFIFNQTYFYSPLLESYVFPIDYPYTLFKGISKDWMPADRARTHFAEYQFKYINDNFNWLDLDARKTQPYDIKIINTKEQLKEIYQKHYNEEYIAIDTETNSLDFILGDIFCITFSFDGYTGFFVRSEIFDYDEFAEFCKNKKIIGQNYKFDFKFFKKHCDNIPLVYSDAFILAQTLNEFRHASLKSLAWIYTHFGGYEKELEDFKKKYNITDYSKIPDSIIKKYAPLDAIFNYRIHMILQSVLTNLDKKFPPKEGEKTVRWFYENVMMPLYNEFCLIEYEGMYIDINNHDNLTNNIISQIADVKKKIYELFNTTEQKLNIDSPKQLGIFIEKTLKWKNYGISKAGDYKTGDDQIVRWIKDNNPGAIELQQYRSLNTILKTFMGNKGTQEGWREYFRNHDDGTTRINASFGVGNAESKRFTCKEPNLQQMPSHGKIAKEFKKSVTIPIGDYLLGTLDYASLQIRLCALNSLDPVLCDIYKTDPDPDLHSTTGYDLVKTNEYEFYKIQTEKGEVFELFSKQKILIYRDGQEIEVYVYELKETDSIIKVVQ